MPSRWLTVPAAIIGLILVSGGIAWAGSYEVESGDTLSEIAAAHDTSWPKIYKANRSVIGSDPNLIFPGQVLEIGKSSAKKSAPPKAEPKSSKVLPATGSITSSYGMRTHPVTGVYKLHSGADFSYGDGNAYVTRSGRVVSIEHPEWAGNLVTIDHGSIQTRYAHLAEVWVSPGQEVGPGDVVGRIGSLGHSTGPHLHFEVLLGGDFVDPLGWLS